MRPARRSLLVATRIFPKTTPLASAGFRLAAPRPAAANCRHRSLWDTPGLDARGIGNRKLVVFVPPEALDAVRDAVFAAGAGRIGDYERCSWQTSGFGTFRALPGANPTIGGVGEEERVAEVRLETIFPAESHDDVIAALR